VDSHLSRWLDGDIGPEWLGVLLRLAHQRWTTAVEAELANAGFADLRPWHSNVFTFVPDDGIQVSELTRLANVRKQTMAQAVSELESLGYVRREPHPRDGRARLVFLTERGRSVRPISIAAGAHTSDRWSETFGAERLDELRRLLADLLDSVGSEDQQ
jgi:DNA-binding MarR family transcriptional regulator